MYVGAYYGLVNIIVERADQSGWYQFQLAPRYSRNPTANRLAAMVFWPINQIDRKMRRSDWPNIGKAPLPSDVQD